MRLIDADEIRPDCMRGFAISQDQIANAPTVDAQPVIHAKWVCNDKDGYPINPYCTNCLNEPYYANTIYNYSFCPFCGAKMDEEQEPEGGESEEK